MFNNNDIEEFMKKAKKMQEKINQTKKSINIMQVKGESGAGLVKIIMNGQYNCIKIEIDPSLLKKSEKNILEDLIVAAFNDANRKIHTEKKNKMSEINPGIPVLKDMNFII